VFSLSLPAALAPAGAAAGVAAAPSSRPLPAALPQRPRRIVHVEDNPSNLHLLAEVMAQRPDVRLETATDGPSGLALLRRAPPDLAILDIDLPGMDGLSLCAALRADPATRTLPLLALTAQAMKGDRERMLGAGFDAVVTKPIDIAQLLAQVDRLLRGRP
jgi:CheY-like chemotaxis protein